MVTESDLVNKHTPLLYLWTKRGASRHCKILGTEKAWEQFDHLEERYFDKQERDILSDLSPEIQAIFLHDKKIQQINLKVEAVNKDLQKFKEDMPILGIEESKITAAVKRKGVHCLGGKESNAYKDKSLQGKLYSDLYRELYRQFGISTYKAIKRNQCDIAIRVIESYEPPLVLAEQISDCNAQINMEVA